MYNDCTAHWKTALTHRARHCRTMEPLRKNTLHQKMILSDGHFFETLCPCKSTSHQRLQCLHRKPFPIGHLLWNIMSLHLSKTVHHSPLVIIFKTSCPCKCTSHQRLPSPEQTNKLQVLVSVPLTKVCLHHKPLSSLAVTSLKHQAFVRSPLIKGCLHQKPLLFGDHLLWNFMTCKCTSHQTLSSPQTIPLWWSPSKHYALVRAPLIKDCLHQKPRPFGDELDTLCPGKCTSHQRLPPPEKNFRSL